MKHAGRNLTGLSAAVLLAAGAHADHGPQTETVVQGVEQAAPIPLPDNSRVEGGTIWNPLDSDLFTFSGDAGDRVRVLLTTSSTALDPRFQIRQPDNALIVDWWCNAGSQGCLGWQEFLLLESGVHTLTVFDDGQNETGDYVLQYERLPFPAAPRAIGYDTLVCDTIDVRTDHDGFRIEMVAGTTMQIAVTTPGPDFDVRYELYDPDDVPIDVWWCNSGTAGCTFVRTFVPVLSGTYRIVFCDNGFDEVGDYCVQINCLSTACPLVASDSTRNGSGLNPNVYTSLGFPVLGSTWDADVDASGHPGAIAAVVFLYQSPGAGIFLPWGEVLVGPTSASLGRLAAVVLGGHAEIELPIPAQHVFAGFQLSSQALLLGGGNVLTNAIDLSLGF